MKTEYNRKGSLRIEVDENCQNKVIFEPVNSTVWLHRSDLAPLFGVTIHKIRTVLEYLVENRLIDTEEVCKYDLFVNSKTVKHDIQEVRLEVVISMAFQINSHNAKTLRKWFVGRCVKPAVCELSVDDGWCLN